MYVFSIKFQNNITQVTYKKFFPSVFYQVCSKCTSAGKMLVTLLTFKWLFARVHHIITLQEKKLSIRRYFNVHFKNTVSN